MADCLLVRLDLQEFPHEAADSKAEFLVKAQRPVFPAEDRERVLGVHNRMILYVADDGSRSALTPGLWRGGHMPVPRDPIHYEPAGRRHGLEVQVTDDSLPTNQPVEGPLKHVSAIQGAVFRIERVHVTNTGRFHHAHVYPWIDRPRRGPVEDH